MHENSRVLLSLRLLPFTDLHERTYISSFFFHIFGVTAVVSYFFLCKFVREIGARLTEIDPLAHALRLTAVFITRHFISRGNLTKKSETAFR